MHTCDSLFEHYIITHLDRLIDFFVCDWNVPLPCFIFRGLNTAAVETLQETVWRRLWLLWMEQSIVSNTTTADNHITAAGIFHRDRVYADRARPLCSLTSQGFFLPICAFPLQALLSPRGWQPQWPSLTCWRRVTESSAWMTCTEVRRPFVTCTAVQKNMMQLVQNARCSERGSTLWLFWFSHSARHKSLLPTRCCWSWPGGVFCWLHKTREAEVCSEHQH